ncbi:MAG: prepilin-type N-terminal cleavage/methylation domain-containing protein [Planctomycetota bacterium]|nr:MAG: prepilin-type N-terminal cleavage/methylation domain-containing protein [Planctomycetota bacterium]
MGDKKRSINVFEAERGFSLAELVVVTIIIGFLAAIAIPRFANAVSRHRADVTANRIIRDLELAQQRAKITSSSQTVRFNIMLNRYRLIDVVGVDSSRTAYVVTLSEQPYRAKIISFSLGGDTDIIFDGRGMPDSEGTITIEVGGKQKTIKVDPDTGRASLEELSVDGNQ